MKKFSNIFFYQVVVFAQKWEIGYLCEKCGKELEKYKLNLVENEEVLINENLYKDNCLKKLKIQKFYIFKYQDIIRNKIIEYKFNDKPYLYKMFCKIIVEDKKICEFLKKYDIIIPVPVHEKRKKTRGYNQSELISKELARILKIKSYTNVLIKIRNNNVQSKLNKKERMKNVKNVYKVINKEKINNKNIIILDDIYTTGATIDACIQELKKTNINKIGVLILAKD